MPGLPPARYAYLGPEGTFTEAALRTLSVTRTADLIAHSTVPSALDAVRHSDVDGAMVPLENSVEGSVAVTLDALAVGEPLVIAREVVLPVSFSVLVRPGHTAAQVKRVATIPHAHAQVPRLAGGEPAGRGAAPYAVHCRRGSGRGSRRSPDAAIAAPIAAERYGLGCRGRRARRGRGADAIRARRAGRRVRRRRRPAPTGRRLSRSSPMTTRGRCSSSSPSSPCAA